MVKKYLVLVLISIIVIVGFILGQNIFTKGQVTLPIPTPSSETITIIEPDPVLVIVNNARTSRSLEPLTQTKELTIPVQQRAENVYKIAQWTHEGFEEALREAGLSGNFGENIARGYGTDTEVVEYWIKSPTHADILFDSCKYAGVGRAGTGVKGTLGYDSYIVLWVGGCK